MGAAVKVTREEHTPQELWRLAAALKDAGHARRVQAISFVLDGRSRGEAAEFAGVDRQTLCDWVERYNKGGAGALATLTSPGRPRLLTPNQAEKLHGIVVKGPDLNKARTSIRMVSCGGAAWTSSGRLAHGSTCPRCIPAPWPNGFTACA